MMSRILGAIGVLWGGAIVVRQLSGAAPEGSPGSAYATGQMIGTIFGAFLALVGAYFLFRPRRAQ